MPTRPSLPVEEPSILTRAAKVIELWPGIRPIEDPHPPLLDLPIIWDQMADDQNEKPQVVRSREPGVGPAREAEERRRVAEIAREIEELGRALEGQDRLARLERRKELKARRRRRGSPRG